MIPVSVVIITKNEAKSIAGCLNAVRKISDDIIVVDSGSTDATLAIAQHYNCRVFYNSWNGYGAAKNAGNSHARYNWILSIDADEVPDAALIKALHDLKLDNPATVYDILFKNWLGPKLIRHGSWGRDHHIRLLNRTMVRWSELQVHEQLIMPRSGVKRKLPGCINHYSANNLEEFKQKAFFYAGLNAKKYYSTGKRGHIFKLYLAPVFSFIKNYIFYMGFMDGMAGWQIALVTAHNTWHKYRQLRKLGSRQQQVVYFENKLYVEY